jgi:hypothetical protein
MVSWTTKSRVLGTSFRTRRRLVRALRGYVDRLPPRQDRLLTLRYGVDGASPRPSREVAEMLDLSPGEYVGALQGLVRAARAGACQVGGAGDNSTQPGYVASGPGSNGRALGATPADSGSQQAAIRVPRRRASGAEPRERERLSGFSIPLALDGERAGSFVIAALVLMAALAGLGLVGLRPLLAAARRHREHA